jgi:hypothetical protein
MNSILLSDHIHTDSKNVFLNLIYIRISLLSFCWTLVWPLTSSDHIPEFRIQIRMFVGLLDPSFTVLRVLYDFLSLNNDLYVLSKRNKQ